jgi:hypothetical protein
LVLAVNRRSAGRDFSLGKGMHRLAQGVNFIAELEVQAWQIHAATPAMRALDLRGGFAATLGTAASIRVSKARA